MPADGEVSGPKGPPWELHDGDIFQCMTAITSLARAAARECSLCEQVPASIEVRCRHSNASRAALWLQQKHCTALCSKGDTTIELAGRLFLLTPHVVARAYQPRFGDHRAVSALPAKAPPSGPGRLHEIKHDGFRILARRDPNGLAVFVLIRGHGSKASAVLCAFDLLELDGKDLRREPIEG